MRATLLDDLWLASAIEPRQCYTEDFSKTCRYISLSKTRSSSEQYSDQMFCLQLCFRAVLAHAELSNLLVSGFFLSFFSRKIFFEPQHVLMHSSPWGAATLLASEQKSPSQSKYVCSVLALFVSQLWAEETIPCQSVGNESWKTLKCWGQVQRESKTMFTMFWKSYFYEDFGPGPRLLLGLPVFSSLPTVWFRPVPWFISVNKSPYLWRCNVSGGHRGPSRSIGLKETLPKRSMNQNQSRWKELFFLKKKKKCKAI